MNFCLPEKEVQRFIQALKDGTIKPEKLIEMESAERRNFFAEIVGENNAREVNALFESKLLLKNQQQGMINWAQKVMGVRPEVKRDLISRIEKLDKVLTAEDESKFLNDLAEQKLGVDVTYEEAKKITELMNEVKTTREAMEKGGDRLDYGRAVVEATNYVNDLKLNARRTTLADFRKNPIGTIMRGVSNIPSTSKAIQSAFDNSAVFRQGWKVLWTHPGIWGRNARKTFADIGRTFGTDKVMDELNADIMSRRNSLNNYYKKAKLAVGATEEAYPTDLPEKAGALLEKSLSKLPLGQYVGRAGRFYKASENAYTGFVHKTRADLFDKYIDIAERIGVDLNDQELVNIGRLVNSLTGRGYMGKWEPAADAINSALFSPRNLKSHVDVLLGHAVGGGASASEIGKGENVGSNFVRKRAAMNILKIIAGTAAVLGLAEVIGKAFGRDDVVEWDPRSADFGKIRIGDTRFDVSGGMASVVVLAARLLSRSTKSTATGKVASLTQPGYGKQNGLDVLEQFFENKASPIGQLALNAVKGETREGTPLYPIAEHKLDWLLQGTDLFTPMPAKNAAEVLQNPNAAPVLAAVLADGLGVGTNTYSAKSKKQKRGGRTGKQGINTSHLSPTVEAQRKAAAARRKAAAQH